MCINEKPREVENKLKVLSNSLLVEIHKVSECSDIAKALKLATIANSYIEENEHIDVVDVEHIANNINKQLDSQVMQLHYLHDDLESFSAKLEQNIKDDKANFARIVYAWINNNEMDKAKKELEKVMKDSSIHK